MSVNRNIVANYFGSAWAAIIQLAFVPLYIGYLGMEAYGLIGFYASLQALLSLLDLGLTPTLTRELARFKAGALQLGDVRALLRTVETLFIGVALVIFVLVVAGSGWLAARWLKTETLPVATATGAICLMGGLIALRWLEGMYRGVIIGLQQLVWLNTVNAAFATLRGVGVLVLVPVVYGGVSAYGAVAAAYAWIAMNAACVAIAVSLMHRKLLPQEQWRWYWQDLALPLAAAFAAAYAVSLAAPAPVAHHNVENLLVIALALVLALFAAVGASPFARGMAARAWRLFSRSPA